MIRKPQWPTLLVSSLLLAVFSLLVNSAIVLFVLDEGVRRLLIDLILPVGDGVAALALLGGAKSAAPLGRRLCLAWATLASAKAAFGLGNTTWAILELGLHVEPFPSLADGFYLAFYPLFLLGILLLPGKRLSRLDWVKTGLDMSIVLLAAVLVVWMYWLGPLAAAVQGESWLVQVLTLAYPAGDLVLLWGLLVLLYRPPANQPLAPLGLLALGMASMIATDALYSYQSLAGSYRSGGWLDLGWLLVSLLFGLAGVWQITSGQATQPAANRGADEAARTPQPSRLMYLPYASVVAAYLLLVQTYGQALPLSFAWLAVGVGGIIGLVLIRQIVTIQENRQINQALQEEIKERKRVEAQLAHDAVHDALTGLPNRVLFCHRLHHAMALAKRRADYHVGLLFLDLDHFKQINDTLGHASGDQLLIGLAHRLRRCVRTSDTVARLAGDEFVILLEDTHDEQQVTATAQRIQTALQPPFQLNGQEVFASVSIGIVSEADHYARPEDALREADRAMYQAKRHSKARSEHFSFPRGTLSLVSPPAASALVEGSHLLTQGTS